MIRIVRKSYHQLKYSVDGIPSGKTVTKAYLSFKNTEQDPDSEEILRKTVTAPNGIVNSSGRADIQFDVSPTDFDSFIGSRCVAGVKLILSDGTPCMLDDTIEEVTVGKPFIESVS